MKTFVIIIVAVGATLGMTGAGWWYMRKSGNSDDATAVRVEPAIRGQLVEVVSAPGQVQPRNKVSISARVSARIARLPFDEGDQVTKGNPSADPPVPPSVLVELDAKELEAALRSVKARRSAEAAQIEVATARLAGQEAQLDAARASLVDAERELKRLQALLATQDVSQADVDQADTKARSLRAQLSAAEENLRADRANLIVMKYNLEAAEAEILRATDALSYTTITSPINGLVTRMNAKEGELVVTGTMNNAGTVIMEVADLSEMLVLARVDESSIANVEAGQKARVYIQAYPDDVFEGIVELVGLAHTEDRDGTRYFKTEVLIKEPAKRLYSGLNADVEILTTHHSDAIKVPSQSVLARPVDDLPPDIRNSPELDRNKTMATVVYRMVDGKAVVTPVRIGPSDMTHTIIRSGLAENDPVITGPYKALESLKHDQKVKDISVAPAAQPTTQPATQPAS